MTWLGQGKPRTSQTKTQTKEPVPKPIYDFTPIRNFGAFFTGGTPAKKRAFRCNLLAKAKRISAAIPGAWAADRFVTPTRGYAHGLLVRPPLKNTTSRAFRSNSSPACGGLRDFRFNPGCMGVQQSCLQDCDQPLAPHGLLKFWNTLKEKNCFPVRVVSGFFIPCGRWFPYPAE
jgi:hypothetical protein